MQTHENDGTAREFPSYEAAESYLRDCVQVCAANITWQIERA
jgi:hypothetical protein